MDTDKNIGKLFKEKLEGYRMEPSPGVWSNIEQKISSSAASGASGFSVSSWWLAPVAAVVVGAAIYFFSASPEPQQDEQAPQMKQIAESPIQPDDEKSKSLTDTTPQDTMPEPSTERPLEYLREPKDTEKVSDEEITEADTQKDISQTPRDRQAPPEMEPPTAVPTEPEPVETRLPYKTDTPRDAAPEEQVTTPPVVQTIKDKDQETEASTTEIRFSEHEPVCAGEELTLKASGGEKYLWFNGSTDSSVTMVPDPAMVYTVTVTDHQGRKTDHEYELEIKECASLFVPNAFVPNGNGINDYFRAYGVGINAFKMKIMDRNGNVVFETTNMEEGWSGDYQNRPAPAGTYLYHIVYTGIEGETKTKTGTLTLIR